ncbi:MAG: hypothetical protein KKG43_05460 [Candidatus Omnitrophica bacterium]|nr:hypothetical protein [Candidatus Omnitrophota bacterium]MBU1928413.1 hypothetical protein [Candidatus Omnitrophota bacterium]MBU2034295.1 hypothetical protein [Candidatus Omnitrophota bacterium]MBU2222271.1 hypothetical protein [Candidatus Omnitrophota bacterium]
MRRKVRDEDLYRYREHKRDKRSSQRGMDLIADIKQIYANYKTEIIVASVRNPTHVADAAKIGADIVTCPFAVIEQLIKHPLTDIGAQRFLEDYEKIPK